MLAPKPVLAAAGLLAPAAGAWLIVLAPGAERVPVGGRGVLYAIVVVGWAFAAIGAVAVRRRPESAMGALLVAFGLVVLATGFWVADDALAHLLAAVADPLAVVIFVHLLLAFPAGTLPDRAGRQVVSALYAVALVPLAVTVLFDARLGDRGCATCPGDPLLVRDLPELARVAQDVQRLGALVLIAAALALMVRRWRRAPAAERRAAAPPAVTGVVLLVIGLASGAAQDLGLGAAAQRTAQQVFVAAFVALPVAFGAGLLRSRFFRTATVGRLLERLTAERAGGLDAALAAALGDPSAAAAHWLPAQQAYVGHDGRPFPLPVDGGTVATPVVHHGRHVGVLVHDASLAGDPQLVSAATGATALALVNERLEVELRAQLEALRDSRTRIVQAGDAERRRLGRDLHDGAQQRLVALLVDLQLARERLDGDSRGTRELVDGALGHARGAIVELRDLAQGIHPAVLSQRGLGAAVESLAARAPVPVELELRVDERLPEAVETAAYFVVAEALTNVAKYAQATHARVGVRREHGHIVVEVVDDGAGGADPAAGSGLRGLEDRVGAAGGTLDVRSPRGLGTIVRARF